MSKTKCHDIRVTATNPPNKISKIVEDFHVNFLNFNTINMKIGKIIPKSKIELISKFNGIEVPEFKSSKETPKFGPIFHIILPSSAPNPISGIFFFILLNINALALSHGMTMKEKLLFLQNPILHGN